MLPASAAGPKPNTKVRVFAMGAKLNLRWLESRQTYRDYIFALADEKERGPGKPIIVGGADDMASHLTGNDLVVWPESIGLFAALSGERATAARNSDSLEGSIATLFGAYAPQIEYYGAKYPELPARGLPTRQLAVALTDTFGRTFLEPFAEMADKYDVWLTTVGDMVQDWQIVCMSKATFTPPPSGEQCAEENPMKVQQLGDPFEPERNYAYEATKPNPAVVAFVFNPDGKLVAKRAKSYLTPTELGPDESPPGGVHVGLDLVPGSASYSDSVPVDTPVGRMAFVISKPAWMPDVLQKIDQRHTDILLQPEFFVGDLARTTGMWASDTLIASGYNDVLRHPSLETLVHPQMEGGVFSFYADQPSHLAIKPRKGTEPGGFILGQPEHPGLVQTLDWVVPDPLNASESMADRRKRLGEAGEKLAPGSGEQCADPAVPGPCEDGHSEGVLFRDVVVNRRPRYKRYRGKVEKTKFSPSKPIAPSKNPQRNVALSTYDGVTEAAYEERRGGRDVVFVTHTHDRGKTWSEPVRVSKSKADQWWPAVALGPKDRLTVAWVEKDRIYFARSSDGGHSFGTPKRLDESSDAAQWKPALARGKGNTVHAAYIDERETGKDDLPQAHVYYKRVGGKAERLDTGSPAPLATKFDNSWAPSIAASGKRVLASWIDFVNYDWDVFTRVSTDGGKTWQDQQLANDTPEADEELADTPRASIVGGRDLVAWTDWRKRDSSATKPHQMYDIFITEPGKENVQVDPYGDKQLSTFAPDICGKLVAFQDASKGQSDIRAAVFIGGGAATGAFRVDDAGTRGGNAWRPRLACSTKTVLAAWEDERDGPAQIYFARSKLSKLR